MPPDISSCCPCPPESAYDVETARTINHPVISRGWSFQRRTFYELQNRQPPNLTCVARPPLVKVFCLSLCFALLTALTPARAAEVPRTIAFQGVLKDASGKPVTTTKSVTFTLYDAATDGNAVWTETKDITPGSSGLFATSLGSATSLTTVTFDRAYWVGVKAGADAEMTSRMPLQCVPYALALPGVTVDESEWLTLRGGIRVRNSGDLNFFASGTRPWDAGDIAFWQFDGTQNGRIWTEGNRSVNISGADNTPELSVADGLVSMTRASVSGDAGIGGVLTTRVIDIAQDSAIAVAPSTEHVPYNGRELYRYGLGWYGDSAIPGAPTCWLSGWGGVKIFAGDVPQLQVSAGQVTVRDSLVVGGPAQAQTLTLTSSARYKANVRPISSALNTIARLQGVSYDWDAAHGGKPDIGFIAEDVAKVVPELVTMEDNGVDAKGMDYSHLTALLVEGIKELRAQNADKDAQLAKQRLQISNLTARLDRLEQKEEK